MISQALSSKVAPVLTAAMTAVDQRLTVVEQEVQRMKLRTAWMERDMMYLQIEVAKTQVVARVWPENFTAADRKLTVQEALKEADIDERFVAINTSGFS